jgi:hypothetical protein
LIIGRHLLGQDPHQAGIARFHRQANAFKVGQRILLAGGAPGAKQLVTGVWLTFAAQPQRFGAVPGLLSLADVPLRIVVIALRLGAGRLIRAEGQQAAPVATARQFVDEP